MNAAGTPERRLSTFDCASIVVGIVVGSGIYQSLGTVAAQTASVAELAALWIAGGLFALLGSLCYAELAGRYPEDGGDFIYLNRAYGPGVGFLFAWTQLWIIRPGSIGALACVFGNYAARLYSFGPESFAVYALGSVAVLTLLNMLGVRQSTRTQNLLTVAKVLGLGVLVVAGLFGPSAPAEVVVAARGREGDVALAMIFVLFAYSGWNEMGCVAAEVRNPQRNILRALLIGAAVVTVVYLGVNAACLKLLGLAGMSQGQAVAATAAVRALGPWGERGLSLLICISALGSTNGMIFTGARIYYAMGKRRPLFAPLAVWHPRFGTPIVSLAVQAAVTLGLLIGFGGLKADDAAGGAFERLVIFMTPPFYIFLMLSAGALAVFRRRDARLGEGERAREDHYRLPLFPLPPLVVALAGAFLTYQSIAYVARRFSEEGPALRGPTIWVVATFATGLAIAVWDKARGGGAS